MRRRGLERSCDWVRYGAHAHGIQRMRAWFAGAAFGRHRHDTYAIGVTESGVQSFRYRGNVHSALPGDVVVLHPDEPHDGYAGSGAGFGYRILYVDPALIAAAAGALPFARNPVLRNARLARTVEAAFRCEAEPLAADAIALRLAEDLMDEAPRPAKVDVAALERARAVLDRACNRVVHSSELEAASALSRYELARQFRARYGTSPYRYSVMRRLERARELLFEGRGAAAVALDAGFSDQAHFSRRFRAAYGLAPGRYRALARNMPAA
jgi:AraC-like DNA-binding protein